MLSIGIHKSNDKFTELEWECVLGMMNHLTVRRGE